jgi:hypothetical protein
MSEIEPVDPAEEMELGHKFEALGLGPNGQVPDVSPIPAGGDPHVPVQVESYYGDTYQPPPVEPAGSGEQ